MVPTSGQGNVTFETEKICHVARTTIKNLKTFPLTLNIYNKINYYGNIPKH
jgi:hypothetical protein